VGFPKIIAFFFENSIGCRLIKGHLYLASFSVVTQWEPFLLSFSVLLVLSIIVLSILFSENEWQQLHQIFTDSLKN